MRRLLLPTLATLSLACAPEPFAVDFRVWPTDLLARDDVPFPTGGPISDDLPKLLQDGRFPALDQLTGFGVTGAITVNFTGEVDLKDLLRRHRGLDVDAGDLPNGGLPSNAALASRRFDFRDDAIFLLNVDRSCRRYGEEVLLDFGRGLFPSVRACAQGRCPVGDTSGGAVVAGDADAAANDLLHEWRDEDANANGLLDEGEDLDADGELDRPYLLFPSSRLAEVADHPLAEVRRNPCLLLDDAAARDRCLVDHTVPFADSEGRTLVLRPAWPLEPGCVHAVLVTDRVRSLDKRPASSPLARPYDPDQAQEVAAAARFLSNLGLSSRSIAFSWTFTTARVTSPFESLRAGLYGHGDLALLDALVDEDLRVEAIGGPPQPVGGGRSASGACVERAFAGQSWLETLSDEEACALSADWMHVSHVASGTFRTLSPVARLARLDGPPGPSDVLPETVGWTCVVPKQVRANCRPNPVHPEPGCAPFPVVLYVHDLGGSRVDLFREAGRLASFGLATCGLDGPAHGYPGDRDALRRAFGAQGLGTLAFQLGAGRAADVDGDGVTDSGAEFVSADPFTLRDNLVQWVFDHLLFVRELRRHDGVRKELPELAFPLGDFDRDGTPDLGGHGVQYSVLGVGWGANVGVVLGAVEPFIEGVAAVSPVAGITDAVARSLDPVVRDHLLRPLLESTASGIPLRRNTRDLRDFLRRAQHALDLVDAAAFAPHLHRWPVPAMYDTWHDREGEPQGPPTPGAALLVLGSIGDPLAPPDAALRLAIAAGLLGDTARSDAHAIENGLRELLSPPLMRVSQRQWTFPTDGEPTVLSLPELFTSRFVAEGVSRLDRLGSGAFADPDAWAEALDGFRTTGDPARVERARRVGGVTQRSGLRFMPHAPGRTAHGLAPADPRLAFDAPGRVRHVVARWLATLDPARPAEPHRVFAPDADPTTRDTKHRIDDRACAACQTTRPVAGCTLAPCDLDAACFELGRTVLSAPAGPWTPSCD